jgi:dynein heavy chain 1
MLLLLLSLQEEYAQLVASAEAIKSEMSGVAKRVDRSVSLLHNLSSERLRWDSQSNSFQTQMKTLSGDCVLAAAFLTYSGFFNITYRQTLLQRWQDKLDDDAVPCKPEFSLIEYLSHPSERLLWQSCALPSDDLCTENAIMLKRFNRYPLVIDPSGQATEFIMQSYSDKKIVRTSFLDDAFLKNLESALRFGNALLVEDVESIDPILNSVLNRETQKLGGRVLIRVGDKDIDFSPSFTLFLATRDPTCHFTPDLCSRVTFVNFTVTPGSLRSQCLTKVLKAERPDIDKQVLCLVQPVSNTVVSSLCCCCCSSSSFLFFVSYCTFVLTAI